MFHHNERCPLDAKMVKVPMKTTKLLGILWCDPNQMFVTLLKLSQKLFSSAGDPIPAFVNGGRAGMKRQILIQPSLAFAKIFGGDRSPREIVGNVYHSLALIA